MTFVDRSSSKSPKLESLPAGLRPYLSDPLADAADACAAAVLAQTGTELVDKITLPKTVAQLKWPGELNPVDGKIWVSTSGLSFLPNLKLHPGSGSLKVHEDPSVATNS